MCKVIPLFLPLNPLIDREIHYRVTYNTHGTIPTYPPRHPYPQQTTQSYTQVERHMPPRTTAHPATPLGGWKAEEFDVGVSTNADYAMRRTTSLDSPRQQVMFGQMEEEWGRRENEVRRKEREWSGEWNMQDMWDVVVKGVEVMRW